MLVTKEFQENNRHSKSAKIIEVSGTELATIGEFQSNDSVFAVPKMQGLVIRRLI
jgi:hypothetical protein